MTHKEKKFVAFYLGKANGNGTLAALMAGFGSTRESSAVLANRLLRKVKVRAAIEAKLDTVLMSQEEVLLRLSERASSSAADFITFDPDGAAHRLPALDLKRARRRGKLGNLKKFKCHRTSGDDPLEIVEVEIHDAMPALAIFAKIHGLLDPKPVAPDKSKGETIGEYLGGPDEAAAGG